MEIVELCQKFKGQVVAMDIAGNETLPLEDEQIKAFQVSNSGSMGCSIWNRYILYGQMGSMSFKSTSQNVPYLWRSIRTSMQCNSVTDILIDIYCNSLQCTAQQVKINFIALPQCRSWCWDSHSVCRHQRQLSFLTHIERIKVSTQRFIFNKICLLLSSRMDIQNSDLLIFILDCLVIYMANLYSLL